MTKYQIAKARAREKAIEWSLNFHKHNYSWGELAYFADYFKRLAKRYGLIEEFKVNGII